MNKKSLFNILRGAISIGLILVLLWIMRGSLGQVILTIKKINKVLLFAAFGFFLFSYFLLGIRFRLIMAVQRLMVNLREAVSLTLIGQFFSNFLPTTIGGDLVKAFYASQKTGKKLACLATVIFDRILGTTTVIITMFILSIFVKRPPHAGSIKTFVIACLAATGAIFFIVFSKRMARIISFLKPLFRRFKLEDKIKSVYDIIYNYKRHPRPVIKAVLASFALQFCVFYSGYLLVKGFGFDVPILMVFLLLTIISTVSMAPSINGLGVREGAFVLLFGPLMTKEGAFAFSILWDGFTLAASLLGGLIYLLSKQYRIGKGEISYDR
ncbi:MAG: lysylphosphatidylglycerol synthase transmembrane domain-containing protein [Candidatus Omnitrophica bacterium]|nr:lysylphosphatidylglycerol synthase transmembrane domain-containing protein [Candidatus Omnitrophota bacterium]